MIENRSQDCRSLDGWLGHLVEHLFEVETSFGQLIPHARELDHVSSAENTKDSRQITGALTAVHVESLCYCCPPESNRNVAVAVSEKSCIHTLPEAVLGISSGGLLSHFGSLSFSFSPSPRLSAIARAIAASSSSSSSPSIETSSVSPSPRERAIALRNISSSSSSSSAIS